MTRAMVPNVPVVQLSCGPAQIRNLPASMSRSLNAIRKPQGVAGQQGPMWGFKKNAVRVLGDLFFFRCGFRF